MLQDYLYTLVTEQLDPIVSPNRRKSSHSYKSMWTALINSLLESSHMHRILGMVSFPYRVSGSCLIYTYIYSLSRRRK